MILFVAAFVVSYAWHMLGVTIGYHRLLSHRSFRCHKMVEYFWVLGGYLALEGSPVWWATIHRAHHRYTEKDRDPHSPRQGWWNSYYGWILKYGYAEYMNPATQARDIVCDPVYRFLEQGGSWHRAFWTAIVIGASFRVLLFFLFGWEIAAGSLAAALIVHQIPLLLNLVCHIPRAGYRTYDTEDDSVNVWWVAVLTAGEGWHNNHHAFPGSARSGLKPMEIDISWLTLRLMRLLGLVGRMNEAVAGRRKETASTSA